MAKRMGENCQYNGDWSTSKCNVLNFSVNVSEQLSTSGPNFALFYTHKLSRPDTIGRGRFAVVGNCNAVSNTEAVCLSEKPDGQAFAVAVHCDVVVVLAVMVFRTIEVVTRSAVHMGHSTVGQ